MQHFTPDQFESGRADGWRKLKPNAIPTEFSHRRKKNPRKPPAKRHTSPSPSVLSSEADSASSPETDQPLSLEADPPLSFEYNASLENEVAKVSGHMAVHGQSELISPTEPLQMDTTEKADESTVSKLKERIAELERVIDLQRKRINTLEKKLDTIERNIKIFLNEDQVIFLERNHAKGSFNWTNETVQNALKMRVACGASGYSVIRDLGFPLPSERTLQRRMENISFNPGILFELFPSMQQKVSSLSPMEREAVLMIDEMALTPGIDFDPVSECVIGFPTLRSASSKIYNKPASHALVFMLGGITSRWKQTIGYHFTGDSYEAASVRDIIFELIRQCELIVIHIRCIVSDMGGHNQALWRVCGVLAGRHGRVINCCSHPCREEKLYFMPDVPHIFKNIRNHLTGNQVFYLPPHVVRENNLPGNAVSIQHVVELFRHNDRKELKLAPRLKDAAMKPNHYEKMKVSLAVALINDSTAAAIECAVRMNLLPNCALTTAWFFREVYRWFKIMTARNASLSVTSESLPDGETLCFLQKFQKLFEELQIGEVRHWKPIQSGVLLATTTSIDLLNYFCQEKGSKFIFLSRFSQDALENLFSTVRCANPVPRCKEFKWILRLITVSQFFRPSNSGSYLKDDGQYLAHFLENSRKSSLDGEHSDQAANFCDQSESEIADHLDENDLNISLDSMEEQALYYLCGEVILKITKKYRLCKTCKDVLICPNNEGDNNPLKPLQEFQTSKEFKLNGRKLLMYASKEVYDLFKKLGGVIRKKEDEIIAGIYKSCDLLELCRKEQLLSLPECHNLSQILVEHFFKTRVFFIVRKINKWKHSTSKNGKQKHWNEKCN